MAVHFGWHGRGIGLDRVHEHAAALAGRSDADRQRPWLSRGMSVHLWKNYWSNVPRYIGMQVDLYQDDIEGFEG
jgi:hypothetical protein